MDAIDHTTSSTELRMEMRRRRVSIYVGIFLALSGAGLAFVGLQIQDQIGAQFVQQIGFAMMVAGLLDLLLTIAVESIRHRVNRQDQQLAEKMTYVKSTLDELRHMWKETEEKQEQGLEQMKRSWAEFDVQHRLRLIEMHVERIRMKLDPEFAEQMIKDGVRRAKELLEKEKKGATEP